MTSVHRKIKTAFVWPGYPEGPRLSVTTQDGEILDMTLSPGAAAALQKQLADVIADHLRAKGWAGPEGAAS